MIRIDITDNGTGIPATKIGEVFRPFQRAHGAHIEGAGIGLALVKRLINRLGGEVSIDSAEGQGTTISILLQSDASV
jgi:signal transduction histidine kinase